MSRYRRAVGDAVPVGVVGVSVLVRDWTPLHAEVGPVVAKSSHRG